MKLRTQFSLMTGILVMIVIAGVSIMLFISQKSMLLSEMRANQENVISGFVRVAEESIIAKNEIVLVNYMKLMKKTEGVMYAMLLDMEDKILGHTDLTLLGNIYRDIAGKKARAHDGFLVQRHSDGRGAEVYEVSMPVLINENKEAVARIGFSCEVLDGRIEKNLRKMGNRILIIAVISLFIGFIGSLVMARLMIRPINQLSRAVEEVGKGKLDYRIKVKQTDELGVLEREFNTMAHKLKEVDEMKQDFVSSVTHELRSPMTSIRMYIGLLFKGVGGTLTEKQEECLNVIKKSTNRLARFIDDLLDVSKIESGKMTIRKEVFDFLPTIQEIVKLMKPQADVKNIELIINVAEGLPKIQADSERVGQIITNLLSNSIKFTQKDGRIELKVTENSEDMEIRVIDNGAGIPKDSLEKVFLKFEQVTSLRDTIPGQKGTGLGLPIVKAIVEGHGGKVRVESELDKGSTFIVNLPKK